MRNTSKYAETLGLHYSIKYSICFYTSPSYLITITKSVGYSYNLKPFTVRTLKCHNPLLFYDYSHKGTSSIVGNYPSICQFQQDKFVYFVILNPRTCMFILHQFLALETFVSLSKRFNLSLMLLC